MLSLISSERNNCSFRRQKTKTNFSHRSDNERRSFPNRFSPFRRRVAWSECRRSLVRRPAVRCRRCPLATNTNRSDVRRTRRCSSNRRCFPPDQENFSAFAFVFRCRSTLTREESVEISSVRNTRCKRARAVHCRSTARRVDGSCTCRKRRVHKLNETKRSSRDGRSSTRRLTSAMMFRIFGTKVKFTRCTSLNETKGERRSSWFFYSRSRLCSGPSRTGPLDRRRFPRSSSLERRNS